MNSIIAMFILYFSAYRAGRACARRDYAMMGLWLAGVIMGSAIVLQQLFSK